MAANDNGKSYYGLGLDNNQLREDAARASGLLKGIGDSAEAEGARIDEAFQDAASAVGLSIAGISVSSFVQKMFQIRSEFQDTESSMRVFLGSAEKASKFMRELQDYAWYNMFEFSDLTAESAKLLAYGNDVETVIPILDKLSNVAAGTNQPLSELVDLYNKAKSIGKVDSQGLESWGAKGVVVVDVLKEMGVEVDRSAIKFEHLEMALNKITGEGGMFNGLMAEQMSNLSASYGQLQDDITNMFNELGQKTEGAMKTGVEVASVLVGNYEAIGKTILELVAVYGVYRVALATMIAAQKMNTLVLRQAVLEKRLAAAAGIQLSNAEAIAASRTKLLALAQQSLVKALQASKAALLANPYVLVAAAVAALAFGIYKLVTAETAAESAQRKLNEATDAAREKKENLLSKIQQLINKINDETQTIYAQIAAWKELQKEMPEAFAGMTIQEFRDMKPADRDKLINKTVEDKEIANANEMLSRLEKFVNDYNSYLNSITNATTTEMSKWNKELGNEIAAIKEKFPEIKDITFGGSNKELKEYIELLKEEKAQRDEINRQAEYEAKPLEEKRAILERQLEQYKAQFAEIEKLVPEEARMADMLDKAVTPAVSDVKEGIWGVNQEWGKFDLQTASNIGQLNSLQEKINGVLDAIKGLTGDKKEVRNESFWEKQKTDALTALKAMEDTAKGSAEWLALEKKIAEAEKKLAIYNPTKNTQQAETAAEKARKKQQEQADLDIKIANAAQRTALERRDAELENQQDLLNLREDGWTKRIEQLNLNYDREMLAVERNERELVEKAQEAERQAWENAGKKGVFTPTTIRREQLSEADRKILADREGVANAQFLAGQSKLYEDLQDKYRSYADKKLAIDKKFSEDYQELLKTGNEDAINEMFKQWKDAFDALDSEAAGEAFGELKKNPLWEKLFGDLDKLTADELDKLLKLFEENKVQLGVQLNPQDLKAVKDAIKGVQDELRERNPFASLIKSIKEYNAEADAAKRKIAWKSVMKDTSASLKFVSDGFNTVTGGIKDMGIEMDASTQKMLDGIGSLIDGATQLAESLAADNIMGAFEGVVKIISSAANILTAGEGKRNEQLDREYEYYNALADTLDMLISKQKELFSETSGRTAMDAYKDAIDLVGAKLDAKTKGLDAWFNKENERSYGFGGFERHSNWYVLNEDFGKYGLNDRKIRDMDANEWEEFMKTNYDIWQRLPQEVREYSLAVIEARDQTEDLEAAINESLTQISFDGLLDDFVNVLMNMDSSAEDFAKNFEKYMQRAIINSLVMEKYKPLLEAWYEAFSAAIADDGEIDDMERKVLEANWKHISDGAMAELDAIKEQFGWDSDESRQASSKGFASMSQDSADELNGRFTALQALTYSIAENTNTLVANSGQILVHLAGIESNTGFCRRLDGMDSDLRAVKSGIDNMNLRGLIIRAS